MSQYSQYNLRDRNQLRQPLRYGETEGNPDMLHSDIEALRNLCRGREHSIIQRVVNIENVIAACGSRTKLLMLRKQLQRANQDLLLRHSELMKLLPNEEVYSQIWVENVTVTVEDCCSNVEEYLVEHINDAGSSMSVPSEGSIDAPSYDSTGNPVDPGEYVQRWRLRNAEVEHMTRRFSELPSVMTENSLLEDQAFEPSAYSNEDCQSHERRSTSSVSSRNSNLTDEMQVENPFNPAVNPSSLAWDNLWDPKGFGGTKPRRLLPPTPVGNFSIAGALAPHTAAQIHMPGIVENSVTGPTSWKEAPSAQFNSNSGIFPVDRGFTIPLQDLNDQSPPVREQHTLDGSHTQTHLPLSSVDPNNQPIQSNVPMPKNSNPFSNHVSEQVQGTMTMQGERSSPLPTFQCQQYPRSAIPTNMLEPKHHNSQIRPRGSINVNPFFSPTQQTGVISNPTIELSQATMNAESGTGISHFNCNEANPGPFNYHEAGPGYRNHHDTGPGRLNNREASSGSFNQNEDSSGRFNYHDASLGHGASSGHFNHNEASQGDVLNNYEVEDSCQLYPVDQWIDLLSRKERVSQNGLDDISASSLANRWLMNQNLPAITIPKFNGDSLRWVDFITHFKEMVHEQPYLTTAQRATYLYQYLEGQALRCVSGFGKDWGEYVRALKRLKEMFGDRARIAQAYMAKVAKGKVIKDNDISGLSELYYDVSDFISNLRRLHYEYDLKSSDILTQVLRRLPGRLLNKWREYSYRLRKKEEPTIIHLESWLQDRVMAARDPYTPSVGESRTNLLIDVTTNSAITESSVYQTEIKGKSVGEPNVPCRLCQENHNLTKCPKFLSLSAENRQKFVREKFLCFNCLKYGHESRNCGGRCCFKTGCAMKHNTLLHEFFVKTLRENKIEEKNVPQNTAEGIKNNRKKENTEDAKEEGKEEKKEEKSVATLSSTNRQVFCKVVKVVVKADEVESGAETHAFLDDGSDGTFINEDFANRIGIQGIPKTVIVNTITGPGEQTQSDKVTIKISGTSPNSTLHEIKDVRTLPSSQFKLRSQLLPPGFESEDYNHLRGLGFTDIEEDDINILIGADNFDLLIIHEVRRGPNGLPVAARTDLGWTLFGGRKEEEILSVNRISLEETVLQFWETESFGTEFKMKKEMSMQDQALLQQMANTSYCQEGHMVVNMLWNDDAEADNLPDSYRNAEKRYYTLRNQFLRNPVLSTKYSNIFKRYIESGVATKVLPSDVVQVNNKVWYNPHYPVINPMKDEPRPVFDLAAKVEGKCLNDFLHTGPDLNNTLIGILLRFRSHPVAMVGDIEAMFHQVRVSEEDSHCLRFLWSEDIMNSPEPDIYRMMVHVFGARDSPCCAAFALKQTATSHQDRYSTEVVLAIQNSFYVDDFLKSLQTVEEAVEITRGVKELLKLNGFNLTKLASNCPEALKDIPESQRRKSKGSLKIEKDNIQHALGVRWDVDSDHFTFSFDAIKEAPYTKRGLLSVLSSVFDPLGFLAPVVIGAKIMVQNLWRRKCGWDEPLTKEEAATWSKWLSDIKNAPAFKIGRWHAVKEDIKGRQLHVFVDASEQAFGAVIYIRNLYISGEVSCHLLISRSRLAPLKTLTIPRLELQAAVLGVRLFRSVKEEIDIEFESITFWTDSTIVLQYINNATARFKVFVANRISEIQEHTKTQQWRFVPGDLNPADDMTRGMALQKIVGNSRWKVGPEFLYLRSTEWPSHAHLPLPPSDAEVRTVRLTSMDLTMDALKKQSSWDKLVDIVGWMLRFCYNVKVVDAERVHGYLKVGERRSSIHAIVRLSQRESFPTEIDALKKNETLSQRSKLLALQPYLDEMQLLRVGGRITNANIPAGARHQMILCAKNWLSKVYTVHMHRLNICEGPNSLLATIRQKFWILGGKRLASAVVKRCLECRKRDAKPTVPLMADLPKDRVTAGNPVFFATGVDFFGPLLTKVKRSTQKRWGSIFTCLSTRAIHLEVVEFIDADSFINAFRRFCNRRGNPQYMRSDCGTNFKGADAELKEALKALDLTKIERHMSRKGIDWKFNPPHAPHMGGVWERLVRTVKKPLYALLKDRVVTDFQLLTFFSEVENLVNSRPLTPVSDDIKDYEALTPNHFLIGRPNPNCAIVTHQETDISSRKRWKQVQYLTSKFWEQWRKEYLPLLSKRCKWNKEQRDLQVGDLVLVVEENAHRGKWKLARVRQVYPGSDGRVRVVQIQTQLGFYVRPVAKLCLIEGST